MAQEPTPLKPVQTSTAKSAIQLPKTANHEHLPIIPVNQHPLRNGVPFGGSFGYYESDDKW